LASILLLLNFYCVYLSIPGRYKHQFFYWFHRIGEPNFDTPLEAIEQTEEKSVIDAYKRRGYKLKCSHHRCQGIIKSAYDIPADQITLWFEEKQLSSIWIWFPYSSFEKLNNYLNSKLANYQKTDQIPGEYNGTSDVHGKPLIVWKVNNGFIASSSLPTSGYDLILRWRNKALVSDSNNGEALTYAEKTLPPFTPDKTSDYVCAINSACKNAYTASVAYTVQFPNPTNITLSNLIYGGYEPTKGITITLNNLSDKGGTITCSGLDEWKIRPAVITITNGFMNMTTAMAMSSSMLDSSPRPEQAPSPPPAPKSPSQPKSY
jgi:hypothetical protein